MGISGKPNEIYLNISTAAAIDNIYFITAEKYTRWKERFGRISLPIP